MKNRFIAIVFLVPAVIALCAVSIHLGAPTANAGPLDHPYFGDGVPGSYVIHFESGGKSFITFHRDGAYTVSNSMGMDEHGSWFRVAQLTLQGAGLAIVQSPNPEMLGLFWLRDKDWELQFTDRSLEHFSIVIKDADMIPASMDPLDPNIKGFFPGKLPLVGIGVRIPVAIK